MPGPRPKYPISLSEAQEAELTGLSQSYTAPFGQVQRASLLLLAHQQPDMTNTAIAQQLHCHLETVRKWRQRFATQGSIKDLPRSGAKRKFTSLARTQITALACSTPPDQAQVCKRWSAEKLAHLAIAKKLVETISASTLRGWLKEDKIKPWQYHCWQKSTDPQFVEKASAVLDLYENAKELAEIGEVTVCLDEKPSIQARQRVDATLAAIKGSPVRVADRYKRMGCVQLFCALLVASGITIAECFVRKCFADFKEFLQKVFLSASRQGVKVLNVVLDKGPTHAPKQLAGWIASLELSFEVKLYWLPKYASWLDQVEIVFSKVQREMLAPNDFSSTVALKKELMAYFDEMNKNPKPINWTYTKVKMMAKFGQQPSPP